MHHHPLYDLTQTLVLRHMYGDVTAADADIDLYRQGVPRLSCGPTPRARSQAPISVQILADATNGTIFYDMDAKTRTVIESFSVQMQTSLMGKSVAGSQHRLSGKRHLGRHAHLGGQFIQHGVIPAPMHTCCMPTPSTMSSSWKTKRGTSGAFDCQTPIPSSSSASRKTPRWTRTRSARDRHSSRARTSCADSRSTRASSTRWPRRSSRKASTSKTAALTPVCHLGAEHDELPLYLRNFRTQTDDYVQTLNYIADASANGTDMSGSPLTVAISGGTSLTPPSSPAGRMPSASSSPQPTAASTWAARSVRSPRMV